jgi:hypothetical protein
MDQQLDSLMSSLARDPQIVHIESWRQPMKTDVHFSNGLALHFQPCIEICYALYRRRNGIFEL